MDVVGAIYDRCRYHAIGRGFCAKIMHCFINTQIDEISLYIVYENYLGSLSSPIFSLLLKCGNFKSIITFFKHVIGILRFAISTNYCYTVCCCYTCLILVGT